MRIIFKLNVIKLFLYCIEGIPILVSFCQFIRCQDKIPQLFFFHLVWISCFPFNWFWLLWPLFCFWIAQQVSLLHLQRVCLFRDSQSWSWNCWIETRGSDGHLQHFQVWGSSRWVCYPERHRSQRAGQQASRTECSPRLSSQRYFYCNWFVSWNRQTLTASQTMLFNDAKLIIIAFYFSNYTRCIWISRVFAFKIKHKISVEFCQTEDANEHN